MTRFNSLLGPNKFPVPTRRELVRKSLNLALDSEPTIHSGGPCEQNNPVYSQLAGNLGSETSSLKTASSTGESCANLIPRSGRRLFHRSPGERVGAERLCLKLELSPDAEGLLRHRRRRRR